MFSLHLAAANVMSAPPRPTEFKRFRKNFGPKERVYIMDAKTTGNVGRYFNVRHFGFVIEIKFNLNFIYSTLAARISLCKAFSSTHMM